MGAAQAALAWCPLLPMRMLLPRSPLTQLQKVGGRVFERGGRVFEKGREGWKTKKGGKVLNDRDGS